MKSLTIAFYILLVLRLAPIDGELIVTKPIVNIEMTEAGLHRDLLYTVQFDYPLAGKECEYVLEQSLPAGVYVSVDQLDDLKRLRKLNAIYPKFVDIELPTERASSFTILLKGIPKITDSIKLPIHFRYNAPSEKTTHVNVDIPLPAMYMNCFGNGEDDVVESDLQLTPDVWYCLQEEESSFAVDSPQIKNRSTKENCNWKLISVDYQMKSPLKAQIPIGNEKAFPPILYATIIVSWIVSLWTVFRTHHVPRRINHKLEEQRILHNKMN